jgi:hypothetical protein
MAHGKLMARRDSPLWSGVTLAAIAVGAYYLVTKLGGTVAGASAAAWSRSPDNWMATGGLFRWSAPRVGPLAAQDIVTALSQRGFTEVTVWQDAYPADWPSDDRVPGLARNRIECRQNTGNDLWIPPSVVVYFKPHAAVSTIVGAPPTDPSVLATSNTLAGLAMGVSG